MSVTGEHCIAHLITKLLLLSLCLVLHTATQTDRLLHCLHSAGQDSTLMLRSVAANPSTSSEEDLCYRFNFGNGSIRGVAAMTIWIMLSHLALNEEAAAGMQEEGSVDMIMSLLQRLTKFFLPCLGFCWT